MTISPLFTSILTVLSTPAGMIGIAVTGVSILGYITYSMFVNTADTTQDMATPQPDQEESFNANQSAEQEVETKEASRGFLFTISSFAYDWTAGWFFTDSTTDKQALAQLQKEHRMLKDDHDTLESTYGALNRELACARKKYLDLHSTAKTCIENYQNEFKSLIATNESLKKENTDLKAELAELEKQQEELVSNLQSDAVSVLKATQSDALYVMLEKLLQCLAGKTETLPEIAVTAQRYLDQLRQLNKVVIKTEELEVNGANENAGTPPASPVTEGNGENAAQAQDPLTVEVKSATKTEEQDKSTPVLFSPNQAEEVPTHLNSDPKQESEAIQNKPGSGNN